MRPKFKSLVKGILEATLNAGASVVTEMWPPLPPQLLPIGCAYRQSALAFLPKLRRP